MRGQAGRCERASLLNGYLLGLVPLGLAPVPRGPFVTQLRSGSISSSIASEAAINMGKQPVAVEPPAFNPLIKDAFLFAGDFKWMFYFCLGLLMVFLIT